MKKRMTIVLTTSLLGSAGGQAGEVDVVGVAVACNAQQCRSDVTLKHQDEGWAHYADRWEIRLSDGSVLATRVLYHPHVNEQPFTRSLGGVSPPPYTQPLFVVGHDSVHNDGKPFKVELPEPLPE